MDMRIRDSFRGALLGTFCGDALGMPFEGWPPMMIKREIGQVKKMYEAKLGAGTYTDDTQMMIALGESLVEKGGFIGEDMALRIGEAFDPKRGYAQGATKILKRIRDGVPWQEAPRGIFPGGSYGNGAAMRIAPIGVLFWGDPVTLRRRAKESSKITHLHPLGIEGAVLQAQGVALALERGWKGDLNEKEFLQTLKGLLKKGCQELQEKLMLVEDLLENLSTGNPLPIEEVAKTLGNRPTAHGSVPAAIYSFLSHKGSFEEAVSYGVGLGGDADTIGAMTGALAGAFHGMEGIPKEWLETLEGGEKGRDYVVKLADRLFQLRISLYP